MAINNAEGFIESGDEITADALNSIITQWGTLAERDALTIADIEGVEWVVTGDTADRNGKRYQVRSGIWVELPTGSDVNSLTTATLARDDTFPFANISEAGNLTRKALISAILSLLENGDIPSDYVNSLTVGVAARTDRIPFVNLGDVGTPTHAEAIADILGLIEAGDIPISKGGTGQTTASAASAALLGIHSVQLVTNSSSYSPTSTVQVTAVASTTGGVTITRGTDEIVVMHDPDEGQFGLVLESTDTVSVDSGYAILSLVS